MNKLFKILSLLVVILFVGCTKTEIDNLEPTIDSDWLVKDMGDGCYQVTGTFEEAAMGSIDVETRAENSVMSGWCLIFGEEDKYRTDDKETFSDKSPLLRKIPLKLNAAGQFVMMFEEYDEVAFIRFMVNLTSRENSRLVDNTITKSWEYVLGESESLELNDENVRNNGVATFGDYRAQSVGLDGIYNVAYETKITGTTTDSDGNPTAVYDKENENQPDPTAVASAFPMSSYGFSLKKIDEATLKSVVKSKVQLIRVCSKFDVKVSDPGFQLEAIYLIDAAQESRIRSTVLKASSSGDGSVVDENFGIPVDLGGNIDYLPLEESVANGGTSSPIYFYPNLGGDYNSNGGAVDKGINPQYVIIKGRAKGYDTDGYYKVALKSQYPLVADADPENKSDREQWSALTYDILRNAHFNINLTEVNKPGYKTLADARDDNNPANNISYNITIDCENGRNEILVSKGTFFAELECSRVYMRGYGARGAKSSVTFTLNPNDEYEYKFPSTYIMGDGGVDILSCETVDMVTNETKTIELTEIDEEVAADADFVVDTMWVKIPASANKTKVKVNFKADGTGNVRMRIGDILKFLPVEYQLDAVSHDASVGSVSIGSEYDLSYYDIKYLDKDDNVVNTPQNWFSNDGSVTTNRDDDDRELRAIVYPNEHDGVTKVYFLQASTTPHVYESSDTNCYILNPSTDSEVAQMFYHIPIERIDEFWGHSSNFVAANKDNTLDVVQEDWEAVILWHDCTARGTTLTQRELILNGSDKLEIIEDKDNREVKVRLSSAFTDRDNQCNVVFAVRKRSDKTILWSWHLWITDYNPYPAATPELLPGPCTTSVGYGELHRYGSRIFNGIDDDNPNISTRRLYDDKWIMDRNIGARSSDEDGYYDKGKSKYVGSLYYQHGRKDPFPNGDHVTYNTAFGYTKHSFVKSQSTSQKAVSTPLTFFGHQEGHWTTEGSDKYPFDGWYGYDETVNYNRKSILDPSPRGFRVPNYKVWDTYEIKNRVDRKTNPKPGYFTFETYASKFVAMYVLLGSINPKTGVFERDTNGYLWSATPSSVSNGINFTIQPSKDGANKDIIEGGATGNQGACGFGVRPIQE